jgi:hypothetical protein
VIGDGFDLYSPRPPELGRMAVTVDGGKVGTAELHSGCQEDSSVVHSLRGLEQGRHGVALSVEEGMIAVDAIRVTGQFF